MNENTDLKQNDCLNSESRNSTRFNFESFKNRNLEISKNNLNSNPKLNSKNKSKNNPKEETEEFEEDNQRQLVERQEFDEKLLAQLNKYIKEDSSFFTEQGKKINQSTKNTSDEMMENKIEEENENKFDGILVKRPPKGFVWGMGNQANKKKCKKRLTNFKKLNIKWN